VPRSTQPSTLRGTVNAYQPYGWVIIHGDGRMFGQVYSLAYELTAIWRWPISDQRNRSELSHMAGAVDDSTINIVVVIIIIIISRPKSSPGWNGNTVPGTHPGVPEQPQAPAADWRSGWNRAPIVTDSFLISVNCLMRNWLWYWQCWNSKEKICAHTPYPL